MDKKRYTKESFEIIELKRIIINRINRDVRTPSDFDFLSEQIQRKTQETLSPTTLKRLWGYITGAEVIRQSTLNILAQFIGYPRWEIFVEAINLKEEGKILVDDYSEVNASDLSVGTIIQLCWHENRKLRAKYLGDIKFIVEHVENCSIPIGSLFSCGVIMKKEPLFINRINILDGTSFPCVLGSNEGIDEITIIK